MTKISSSPTCRCRGSSAPGAKRVIWTRRFVGGSCQRILNVIPGLSSCQATSLTAMIRDRGLVVMAIPRASIESWREPSRLPEALGRDAERPVEPGRRVLPRDDHRELRNGVVVVVPLHAREELVVDVPS